MYISVCVWDLENMGKWIRPSIVSIVSIHPSIHPWQFKKVLMLDLNFQITKLDVFPVCNPGLGPFPSQWWVPCNGSCSPVSATHRSPRCFRASGFAQFLSKKADDRPHLEIYRYIIDIDIDTQISSEIIWMTIIGIYRG